MNDFNNLENLYDFYKTRCDRYADCMLFDNKITYGDAYEYAEAKAAYLQKQGYKKGDVIGLLAANSAEWCITYMAITMMGAIILPLDPNLPAKSYPAMLKEVKCRALFISDEYKKTVKRVKIYDVDLESCVEYKKNFKPVEMAEGDVAAYVFTSGTTGKSKIVMISQKNVYSIGIATSTFMNFEPGDINLCILPLFHVYALCANFTGPFSNGGAFVFQPSLKGPDIMQSLAENPITVFPAAPQLWELFMDAILNKVRAESMSRYRIFMFFLNNAPIFNALGLNFLLKKIFKPVHDIFGHSHRAFISGGAALKSRYIRYYKNMGFTLVEGYGLTETTGPITLDDYKNNVAGSVGKASTGNKIKIKNINSDGIGEVWLGGDGVMLGYYNNDEANAEAFDDERFFNSGDLGRLDKKGNLFLTGRSKNVIVLSSGKNVYPEELESYYKQSDEIADIAVFGMTIDGKETVYSVIVPFSKGADSYQVIKDEITRLNRGLPDYKIITNFAVSFDPLPTNTTRKVLYSEVSSSLSKGLYQENEADSAVLQNKLSPQSPGEEMIINLLKKRLNKDLLYANQTLRDFDIDSLGLVDFVVYLEENLRVSIDPKELKKRETLEEIVQYLLTLEEQEGQSIDRMIFEGKIEKKAYSFFNPAHHVVLFLFKLISRLFWRVKIVNKERMIFDNNIIVSNHQSYLEMFWLGWAFPAGERKNIYVTGKKKMAFVRYIFPILPVIWIEEDNALDVLKKSADILRQGKSLLIYPEGTRTDDGKMHEFKTGAGYLAKSLNVKIVPVTANGAYDIWPKGQKSPSFFTRKRGSLTIGETIDPADFDSVESLTREMEKSVRRYLKE